MSDTPVDWDDMQGVTFTVEVRVKPTDPSYGLSVSMLGDMWVRDGDPKDEATSMCWLNHGDLAAELADRLVGRDFDSLWTIAAVRPAPQ